MTVPQATNGHSDNKEVECQWIRWRPGSLDVDFLVDRHGHVYMHSVRPAGTKTTTYSIETEIAHCTPLVQIRLKGEGSYTGTSERLIFSPTSSRLVYLSHREWIEHKPCQTHKLEIVTEDPETGLQVHSRFYVFDKVPVLRSQAVVTNRGEAHNCLTAFASLSLGYLNRGTDQWWKEYDAIIPNNTNFREAQWQTFSLPSLGLDYCGSSDFNLPGTRASIVKSNLGTFSTCGSLPMGALSKKDSSQCYVWQIEHSGAWKWEIGNVLNGLYVVASGPNEQDHHWSKDLAPGDTFNSVATALTVVKGNVSDAFAPLTEYRRRIRRQHKDNQLLPVIFNDYMNCLDGDPTEEKVLALVEPARKCGAEYFCIDAGWYSDEPGWWDTVGSWEPSAKRFPSGLRHVCERVRSAGMIPGLWMEPEVIGIKSSVVDDLPHDAYFQRTGQKVVEQSRYQLDFRHEAVINRLDQIVDGLIANFGVGYFKFDYNIDVTQGTDVNASSPGDGMLEHRRAYIAWIGHLYDRHPTLVIESCSSGAMRLDYETLSAHSLQSTSDQTDPLLYSAISANVLTALTPEQSASWAYPQPEYSDELNGLTLINSLVGRFYLSGRIDLLNHHQLQLVVEASDVYRSIRGDIKDAVPFWPMGLHSWHDEWLVLGLRTEGACYLAVWRRGGSQQCSIPLSLSTISQVKVLFPAEFPTTMRLDKGTNRLHIELPTAPSARLLRFESR